MSFVMVIIIEFGYPSQSSVVKFSFITGHWQMCEPTSESYRTAVEQVIPASCLKVVQLYWPLSLELRASEQPTDISRTALHPRPLFSSPMSVFITVSNGPFSNKSVLIFSLVPWYANCWSTASPYFQHGWTNRWNRLRPFILTVFHLSVLPTQQSKDCLRLDETMLVKQLLPEICHFIHTYREGHQHAAELRSSASAVLFSLSCNNFNAVFSRISTRYF